MSIYKGKNVEVRYSDADYSRVWVVLPDQQICEAQLITPSSLINPNKQTLKIIAEARAHERKVAREFHLLHESQLRGESTEDRIALVMQETSQANEEQEEARQLPAEVQLLTRMDRPKLRTDRPYQVTPEEVAKVRADYSIFDVAPQRRQVQEFDDEETA